MCPQVELTGEEVADREAAKKAEEEAARKAAGERRVNGLLTYRGSGGARRQVRLMFCDILKHRWQAR
jgi:hypothetical protein